MNLRLILIILICSNLFIANSLPADSLNLADNQVFHRGNYDEPDTLDPQKAFSAPDYNILQDLYEGLFTFDQNGKIILGQAKSYTVSKDKTKYLFKLKENLKWSNGAQLTAFDFEYGIKRALDPDIASSNFHLLRPIKNSIKVLNGELDLDNLGVKALDKNTLEIILEHPVPYLSGLLTHNTFMPVYKPNIEKYGDSFTNANVYVTNGPFKLQDWVVNSHLTLTKNNYYANADFVYLDKVIFYPINLQSTELNRYRAGDLDYTAKVPIENLSLIKKKYNKELYVNHMLAAYYYNFNVTKAPFKDNKNLRKALALAVDKDVIANKILGGGRTSTDRFVPRYIDNYTESKDSNLSYKQKIELAKEYYTKAGYSAKNPLKVKLLYHTNESNKLIASAVASMWKKALGVQTELVNQEWKVFLKTRVERQDTEVFREGWIASYSDPIAFLELYTSYNPQNSSGYNNIIYDNLIAEANSVLEPDKRLSLLKQAEDLLLDDAPIIPVYNPLSYHLVKPYVGGLSINMLDTTLDRYIYIKKNTSV